MSVVVSVYDRSAKLFGRPAFVPSTGVAIRSFTAEVNRSDSDNVMFNSPSDFSLWYLCDYDDTKGEFLPIDGGKVKLLDAETVITK